MALLIIYLSSSVLILSISLFIQTEKETTAKKNDKDIFVTVEQMPQFPGGEMEMHKFINENLKYPKISQEEALQGRVTIRFIVTKTGEISDITVVRSIASSFDQEVVRVVKAMPKWIPGKQDGKEVDVYFTLPIQIHFRE